MNGLMLMKDCYTPPAHGWTCFHCGDTFAHSNVAREHFGGAIDAIPGCRLRMRAGERSLLRRIRWLENQLRRYRCEDGDAERAMQAMASDHRQALILEEEKGYAKGLRDAGKEPCK